MLLTATAVLIVAGVGGGAASRADVQHGISFTKGCVSPTQIGQPYTCTYSIRNKVDDAQDTLTINGLVDVVHAAGGDVSSGNVFSSLRFVIGPFLPGFSTPPTCTGPAYRQRHGREPVDRRDRVHAAVRLAASTSARSPSTR